MSSVKTSYVLPEICRCSKALLRRTPRTLKTGKMKDSSSAQLCNEIMAASVFIIDCMHRIIANVVA